MFGKYPLISDLKYTEEEKRLIINFLIALNKPEIKKFLYNYNIPVSGTKSDLYDRIEDALNGHELSYASLVDYIDTVEPWEAQHVILLKAPMRLPRGPKQWRNEKDVRAYLSKYDLADLLNRKLPLILPRTLQLSSIEHCRDTLRVVAVERRDVLKRIDEYDSEGVQPDGSSIEYKAYRRVTTRGLISLEWNFITNEAMIQISQLPTNAGTYEDAVKNFGRLIKKWLDISVFRQIDLRRVVSRFYDHVRDGTLAVRLTGIDYMTVTGRRLAVRSASSKDPLLGANVIDTALDGVRKNGAGHEGNFYVGPIERHLPKEVHVKILAHKGRLNLTTGNSEEVVRYVLRLVRENSR